MKYDDQELGEIKRYLKSYVHENASGCWMWYGALNTRGYGTCHWGGWQWLAHRLSYIAHNPWCQGNLDDLYLHHEYKNECCINPEHLKPMTPWEHIKRTVRDSET
jgi:hypothetical protein